MTEWPDRTSAWVNSSGGLTEIPCIEGTRILTLEDCTVSVISAFPDGTAYVITRKTFPKAVIDAGRRKWKTENHARAYGSDYNTMNQQQWQAYTQNGFDFASQQRQQTSYTASKLEDEMIAALMGMTLEEYLRHKGR